MSTTAMDRTLSPARPAPPEEVQCDYDACVEARRHLSEWTGHVLSAASQAQQQQQQQQQPRSAAVGKVDSGRSVRPLYASERQTLADNNCRCLPSRGGGDGADADADPWSSLRLLVPSRDLKRDFSATLKRCASNSTFQGTVVLVVDDDDDDGAGNVDDGDESALLGVHSNLHVGDGCILSLQSSVVGNNYLSQTFVGSGAVVHNCGRVTYKETPARKDWTRLELEVGPESGGGRKLLATPESNLMHLCDQLASGGKQRTDDSGADLFGGPRMTSPPVVNLFCPGAKIRDTPTLANVVAYPKSHIEAATCVEHCLLYPSSQIQNGCVAKHALMQWNTSIIDSSVVEHAIIMEASHVGPNSTIHHAVLGPDVHVSCGEVHASLLGSNTNAHHQSLVISVIWPLGRGNVGYGANVGSNHTGRLPDQETLSGEGAFWGLGTVIKFPVSLQEAPYSVVAAGTTLPPQRLRMPFSLVLTSSTNGGRNSLLPGWVLKSSPYTLARNQVKFAQRRKAKHHHHYTGWDIIRPETVELCVWARKALQTPDAGSFSKALYFGERDIPGIGPNELIEKGRKGGIEAYTNCIQRFALRGLLKFLTDELKATAGNGRRMGELPAVLINGSPRLESDIMDSTEMVKKGVSSSQATWHPFPWHVDQSAAWVYQRKLLLDEFPPPPPPASTAPWICDLLRTLVRLEHQYAKQVYQSKHRDDTRGSQTIPGYGDSHVAAEDDPVIAQVHADASSTEAKVTELLAYLEQYSNSSPRTASKL